LGQLSLDNPRKNRWNYVEFTLYRSPWKTFLGEFLGPMKKEVFFFLCCFFLEGHHKWPNSLIRRGSWKTHGTGRSPWIGALQGWLCQAEGGHVLNQTESACFFLPFYLGGNFAEHQHH
jgi:hypothetical protein